MATQLERQPACQNNLVPAWSLIKEQPDSDLWSLSGANPSSGSKQTKVVVTAMAIGTPAVKFLHQ